MHEEGTKKKPRFKLEHLNPLENGCYYRVKIYIQVNIQKTYFIALQLVEFYIKHQITQILHII